MITPLSSPCGLLATLVLLAPVPRAPTQDAAADADWELVESVPVETTLDNADLREAHVVWPEMIDGALERIEFSVFYASDEPGSPLGATMEAIGRAVERGVRVRLLSDEKFRETYPETLAALAQLGVEVRSIDVGAGMGGVLHSKYFVVDASHAFIGSQNFDWRSLGHILELGLRLRDERIGAALGEVFELDWDLAGGATREQALRASEAADDFPVTLGSGTEAIRVTPALSPTGWLPDERLWDLPRIVEMIDAAEERVRLQVMTYKMVGYDRVYDGTLESALRRAAARGVPVELLIADWSKRKGTIEGLQSLQALPGIEVRLITIPQASTGFVPFARVAHAKYLVVDGARAWLGSSNWQPGYFKESRNVGLTLEGTAVGGRLEAYFGALWNGTYAYPVDPCADYEAPRIGR